MAVKVTVVPGHVTETVYFSYLGGDELFHADPIASFHALRNSYFEPVYLTRYATRLFMVQASDPCAERIGEGAGYSIHEARGSPISLARSGRYPLCDSRSVWRQIPMPDTINSLRAMRHALRTR